MQKISSDLKGNKKSSILESNLSDYSLGNMELNYPRFSVPMWNQFQGVFIVTE